MGMAVINIALSKLAILVLAHLQSAHQSVVMDYESAQRLVMMGARVQGMVAVPLALLRQGIIALAAPLLLLILALRYVGTALILDLMGVTTAIWLI